MLKNYASYFASFIINNIKNIDNIERIILYGSVAKGEENKESDVDIFIETRKKTKLLEKELKGLEESFYNSRESSLFKIKGVENKFNVKIGILKDWKELYKSIASTGITLYGRYEAKEMPAGLKHKIIIFWDKIRKNRGAFLNKIYGFKTGTKRYPGLLTKFGGSRIGKSCVIFPIEHKEEMFELMRKYKVDAKTIDVFMS